MTGLKCPSQRTMAVVALVLGALLSPSGMSASRGSQVLALIAEGNGNLDRLDITTGSHTVIMNNGAFYDGLAFNANESVLYGAISDGFGGLTRLVTIDPITGTNTPVGDNGVALATLTNLADGRLFGVDFDDNLYQINPNTGAATLIGPTGLPSLIGIGFGNSLASDGTTLYYTLETNGGNSTLYTLDTTTGAAVAVGPTGTNGIVGSAFAGPTFGAGQLYGFRDNGETDVINLSTGAATLLNSNGLTDIFGGVGIVTAAAAVPEPSTLIGATLGVALALGYAWRRHRRARAAA